MQCTWDPIKRRQNVRKHGIDFADAARLFDEYVLEAADDRFADGRWAALGLLEGLEVFAAYLLDEAENGEELLHWISVRRATSHEKAQYWHARRATE